MNGNQEYADIMSRANLIAREVYNNREKYPDDMWHLSRAFSMLAKEEILATQRADSEGAQRRELERELAMFRAPGEKIISSWDGGPHCKWCGGTGYIRFVQAPSPTGTYGDVTWRQCLHNGTYVDGSLVMALPNA